MANARKAARYAVDAASMVPYPPIAVPASVLGAADDAAYMIEKGEFDPVTAGLDVASILGSAVGAGAAVKAAKLKRAASAGEVALGMGPGRLTPAGRALTTAEASAASARNQMARTAEAMHAMDNLPTKGAELEQWILETTRLKELKGAKDPAGEALQEIQILLHGGESSPEVAEALLRMKGSSLVPGAQVKPGAAYQAWDRATRAPIEEYSEYMGKHSSPMIEEAAAAAMRATPKAYRYVVRDEDQ